MQCPTLTTMPLIHLAYSFLQEGLQNAPTAGSYLTRIMVSVTCMLPATICVESCSLPDCERLEFGSLLSLAVPWGKVCIPSLFSE